MISTIISTFNGEKYIRQCIESVLNQNQDIELIICDDCSTDSTMSIVSQYKCNIIVNKHHTGGPNKGRNNGIRTAKGEYIAFLDQDDYWLPNKLTYQLQKIDGYDLAYSNLNEKLSVNIYYDIKNWNCWPYIGSLLIKNNNIPIFRDFQLDYEWLLELTKNRKCIQTSPMVVRRKHDKNLSLSEEFVLRSYDMHMRLCNDKQKINASIGKYYFRIGQNKRARYYFLKSDLTLKNVAYYLVSYLKINKLIVKLFNVFG